MTIRAVGRVATIAALACTVMAVHCPGSHSSASASSTSISPAPEKRLPNLGGARAKGPGGLLGGLKPVHGEAPDAGSSHLRSSAPSFQWTNKSPGVVGGHHRQG
jgi:hypothetical protein